MTKAPTLIAFLFSTFTFVFASAQETITLQLTVPTGAHVLVSSSAANYDINVENGVLKLELGLDENYELKVEKEGFVSQDINVDTHSCGDKTESECQFTVHLYKNSELEMDDFMRPVNLLNMSDAMMNSID